MRPKRMGMPRVVSILTLVSLLGACATIPDDEPPTPPERPEVDAVVPSKEELIQLHLDEMDLRRRIGQRFMIFVPRGFGGIDEPDETTQKFIRTIESGNPAGMIVYPWNYENRDDVIHLTDTLQTLAERSQPGRRLLISADQEGGRVAAFRFSDIVRLPSAAAVGRHEDPTFVESLAYVTGRELFAMGINMNLAPVLDLTEIPDDSIIGDRSFGDDPELVSEFAERYVLGMDRAGVIATAKHFPGHGVTRVDSHGRLPIVSYTLDDLRSRDLRPFAASIDADIPVVMTAHILFPVIDPDYPVTMSERFLQDILRGEIGFDGVVISDGLEMGALAADYDLDTTLKRAIRSGVDLILLYTRYELLDVIDRVEQMVLDGRLTEQEIDRGVERILALKHRYDLLDEPYSSR